MISARKLSHAGTPVIAGAPKTVSGNGIAFRCNHPRNQRSLHLVLGPRRAYKGLQRAPAGLRLPKLLRATAESVDNAQLHPLPPHCGFCLGPHLGVVEAQLLTLCRVALGIAEHGLHASVRPETGTYGSHYVLKHLMQDLLAVSQLTQGCRGALLPVHSCLAPRCAFCQPCLVGRPHPVPPPGLSVDQTYQRHLPGSLQVPPSPLDLDSGLVVAARAVHNLAVLGRILREDQGQHGHRGHGRQHRQAARPGHRW
mmetsp:Transcript_9547/g.28189  ORF Transcript_9547/g.28189 Transcript_9547/m.28189 type:complete len:254 (+) Transcript_9547:79-840(+)